MFHPAPAIVPRTLPTQSFFYDHAANLTTQPAMASIQSILHPGCLALRMAGGQRDAVHLTNPTVRPTFQTARFDWSAGVLIVRNSGKECQVEFADLG